MHDSKLISEMCKQKSVTLVTAITVNGGVMGFQQWIWRNLTRLLARLHFL